MTATASGRPGTLTATATVPGASTPASFGLTDIAAPTTLTLTSFSPSTDPTAGDTVVTLHGTNLTGITGVSFAGVPATSFSSTGGATPTLTATTPAHPTTGTVDITVTTGTQTATIHGYTYLDAGSIAPNHYQARTRPLATW